MAFDSPAIVLDIGSHTIKVGLSNEQSPADHFPPYRAHVYRTGVIWYPKKQSGPYYGHEALNVIRHFWNSRYYALASPMSSESGQLEDWWSHHSLEHILPPACKTAVGADFGDNPVVVGLPFDSPSSIWKNVIQCMFEYLEVPSLYMAATPALSLLSSGKTTGLVLEVGHKSSGVTACYEGHPLRSSIQTERGPSGADLDDLLALYVRDSTNYSFVRNEMKELFFSQKRSDSTNLEYKLPDGKKVSFENESYFNQLSRWPFTTPMKLPYRNQACPTVQDMVAGALQRTTLDIDLKEVMGRNILVCGGSTALPGFKNNLQKEVSQILPSAKITVHETPCSPIDSAWVGGAIVASLNTFPRLCMLAGDYEEYGPSPYRWR
ncbi:hypothetical protein DL96DRAFT_1626524 [Flagelloscypha sp. PMI_526]|nr:hypothetical protein DL96DRAFT_1626524 [Flagelloscypha sp. PMI_526]